MNGKPGGFGRAYGKWRFAVQTGRGRKNAECTALPLPLTAEARRRKEKKSGLLVHDRAFMTRGSYKEARLAPPKQLCSDVTLLRINLRLQNPRSAQLLRSRLR